MAEVWSDFKTLQPGLTLSVPERDRPGRIEISSGTVAASPLDGDYEEGAVVPTLDWRDPTRRESTVLLEPDGDCRAQASIAIVAPTPESIAPFREFRQVIWSATLDDVLSYVAQRRFAEAIKTCAQSLEAQFGVGGCDDSGEVLGGIRVNAVNLRTVTVDATTGKRIGMHVDSDSHLPLTQRYLAPHRICVNLGSEPRYLLFVNLSIGQLIASALQSMDGDRSFEMLDRTGSGTNVGRTFMRSLPEYPVVRLRVYPGEAYIAPTENMIHDDSSVGMREPDVSLSLRDIG
jgi:hypothetical protein